MIDIAIPAAASSPSEDAYFSSLHAQYPSRPFRLFDLPPELRDAIYDYALLDDGKFKLSGRAPSPASDDNGESDETPRPEDALDEAPAEEDPAPSMQATIKYRPFTNLLLANKMLKREYEERAQNAMKIVLKDNDKFAFNPFTVPEEAVKVQHFEAHLILFCHSCSTMSHADDKTCHAALELNQHQIWLNKLLPELQNLRSLAIHAYISHDRYRTDKKQKLPCERVVLNKFQEMRNLAKAKNLSLYKYDYNGYPDLDGPKAAVWEWSLRDGVRVDEKPSPQAEKEETKGDAMEVDEIEIATV